MKSAYFDSSAVRFIGLFVLASLVFAFIATAQDRTWQTGIVLEIEIATRATSEFSIGIPATSETTATGIGSSDRSISPSSASLSASVPIYVKTEAFAIESDRYYYFCAQQSKKNTARLVVNSQVYFFADKNSLVVLDRVGKQHVAAITKLIEKPKLKGEPQRILPVGDAWKSEVNADRWEVTIDGEYVHADRLSGDPSSFLKIDAKRSGALYVGKVHFGSSAIDGTCNFDSQAEFTRVTSSRIEGAIVVPPPDAQLDYSRCRYSKPNRISTFVWIPE